MTNVGLHTFHLILRLYKGVLVPIPTTPTYHLFNEAAELVEGRRLALSEFFVKSFKASMFYLFLIYSVLQNYMGVDYIHCLHNNNKKNVSQNLN